jgi:uncharacterized repeat protein (TIGR03803 family)
MGTLAFDAAGNLYGTTLSGGTHLLGAVFQLTPSNDSWNESVIHSFNPPSDGEGPIAGVTIDATGNLYGTTQDAGEFNWGTVYQLSPTGSSWNFTVLHAFGGSGDGGLIFAGVALDTQGSLYGAASEGGAHSLGRIFKLSSSGGTWTETVLHDFAQLSDGAFPEGTPLLASNGHIYGTTAGGGSGCRSGCGVVYEIAP